MKKETILDEAKRIVYGERGENYGHPFEDFSRTAKIWSAILDIEITPEQVALCMVGLKISREVNRPKRDNVVDGAGYFENLDMVKKERSRRASMQAHPSYKKPKTLKVGEAVIAGPLSQSFIDWHTANKDIYGVTNIDEWNNLD
jgi:hypothetical protein